MLRFTTFGSIPATLASNAAGVAALVLVDLEVILVEICIILSIGSLITVSLTITLSISCSSWYLTLYLISFKPLTPCWRTAFLVSVPSLETSLVIVS